MPKQDTISDEKIIRFVRNYIAKNRHSPAVRDLFAVGFRSASAAQHRINRMVDAGRLGRTPGISRSIYVKEEE